MTTDRGALAALLASMTLLTFAAGPAAAQTEQAAPVRGLEGLARPDPQTTIPIPEAPKIVLPSETPAPRRTSRPRTTASRDVDKAAADKTAADKTSPAKAGSTRPITDTGSQTRQTRTAVEPARAATTGEPAPAATTAPEPARLPSPSQTPAVDTAPQAAPSPQDVPQPAPTSVTSTESTIAAPETGRAMPLWLSLAVIIIVLAALWALRRKPRGRRNDQRDDVVEPIEPSPEPVLAEPVARPAADPIPAPPTPAAIPATPVALAVAAPSFLEPRAKAPPPAAAPLRARITCDLRPLRAGLNLLSATVECELVVANTGAVPAEAVRIGVALLTAHAGQDSDLAQFNAAPIARPATPPFVLAPGETRTIRATVAVARDLIQTMTAANRPMFVPVVATNIVYRSAGDEAQIARAWVVGIERTDSAKLAPFWLDGPAKMVTSVAARPHGAIFER
ncbi:hypothetical protein HMP09_3381 [Sphingomonas sp. HMP9]|uniref:hypothetical protein n=1 Tax=Sphingomonas sp. HMP9 TaxID=1517554 RepID=UPI0015966253|nr:hypothetical protein [Sphingomonas sp. HMP9]BCA64147.1 hypothetical protein HMP09_3381 [Sphingomonas sp. HMP9]